MEEHEYIDELDDDIIAMEKERMKHKSHKNHANWGTVLLFLKEKQIEVELKETEWMVEKHQLKQKISTLEAQNKAFENSNND